MSQIKLSYPVVHHLQRERDGFSITVNTKPFTRSTYIKREKSTYIRDPCKKTFSHMQLEILLNVAENM